MFRQNEFPNIIFFEKNFYKKFNGGIFIILKRLITHNLSPLRIRNGRRFMDDECEDAVEDKSEERKTELHRVQ